MRSTKEQLLKYKEFLLYLNKAIPSRKKVSLGVVGGFDIAILFSIIDSLLEKDFDFNYIIEALFASGIATGIIILVVYYYGNFFDKIDKKSDFDIKVRNRGHK